MMGTYYRNSKGAMLVYDIGDRSSLDAIGKWHKELVEHAAKDVVVVLVGNKSDLDDDRVVSVEEGAQVAKKYGMLFTEASAKTGAHVQTAFTDLMAGASL
jgi:GTPase SAR1 family protein